MMRAWAVRLGLGLAVALVLSGAGPASMVEKLKVKSVTLGMGHRVFTDFYDEATVRLNEEFRVGDTEYTAKLTEFVPDFTMDMTTRRISSRSNAPNNPAFHVFVRKKGAPDDTTWAFLNMPPHYGRKSMLAFRILKIEFENHEPIVAKRDSSRVAPARKP